MFKHLKATLSEAVREGVREVGSKVRQEIDNRQILRPSSSEIHKSTRPGLRPRTKIAHLRLVIHCCHAIMPAAFDRAGPVGAVGCYCIVKVEGMRRSTAVVQLGVGGTESPTWNVPMNFDITDLHAHVTIQVWQVNSVGGYDVESKLLGQAIAPVARFLPPLRPPSLTMTNFHGLPGTAGTPIPMTTDTNQWMELYPLQRDSARFERIPEDLAWDVRGMQEPEGSLGRVNAEFHLVLEQSLLSTYFAAQPPAPPHVLAAKGGADGQQISVNAIRWNAIRIQDALFTAPSWWTLVARARSWESVTLSVTACCVAVAVPLKLQLWQAPILTVGAFAWLSLYSASENTRKREKSTPTWHVVPELPEGLRNQTVIGKALAGKAMILKAQRFTGTAAGILERIRNAFNWSDPNVSLVVWSWVCFLGATSSVLLYLSEGLWAIVSPRQIAACVMLMQFLPPRIRKALDVMENPLLRGVILDVTAAVGIEVQESMEDEDDFVKLDLLPGDFMGSDHHSDSDAPQAVLGVAGRAVRAGARMLYQIPDEMTMVHRTIANRQVCAAPRQPVASTRHSVASANVLNDDLAGIDVRPAKEKEHGWSSRVHKSAVGGRGMKLGAAGGRASTADTLEAEVEAELEELRTAPVSIEEAMKLSVSELKMRLKAAGVVSEGFMEKKEFAEALMIHSSSSASPRTGGAGGGYSSAPAQRGANSSASQERGSNSAPARGGGYSSMAAQGAVGGGAGGEGAEEKLALLEEMGLSDAEENRRLLGVYHGDVDDVVRHLLNRV